jgi:hypothetical protein
MFILRALCRWFPGLRFLWVGIGYGLLVVGGVVWFVCFPLTAWTIYYFREFPFTYFGVPFYPGFPVEFFLPKEMWPMLVGVCGAFAFYGLFVIYFNVRRLRRLRRGEA